MIERTGEGIIVNRIKGKENGRDLIITVYNNEGAGDTKERTKEIVEEYKNELIVLADFIARIGEVGGDDEEG